jgi:hypothetical protein
MTIGSLSESSAGLGIFEAPNELPVAGTGRRQHRRHGALGIVLGATGRSLLIDWRRQSYSVPDSIKSSVAINGKMPALQDVFLSAAELCSRLLSCRSPRPNQLLKRLMAAPLATSLKKVPFSVAKSLACTGLFVKLQRIAVPPVRSAHVRGHKLSLGGSDSNRLVAGLR